MDLYFSPLAGSLAARIALYEVGAEARFIEVDPKTKRTPDGSNFAAIHPIGLVPLLRLDDGSLLSENAAVLQYIANRFPESNLAPTDELARARLQQWLSFIGTELHQRLFCVLLDEAGPKGTRTHTLMPIPTRRGHRSFRHYRMRRTPAASSCRFIESPGPRRSRRPSVRPRRRAPQPLTSYRHPSSIAIAGSSWNASPR